MSRRRLLIAALGAGLALAGGLVAALVLLTGGRGENGSGTGVVALQGVSRVTAMLNGIPQEGTALGSPKAPVMLVEFADLQCPYCARWAQDALPGVVARYVRTGKVRVVFSGMAFVGPDSETALRTALAAAQQQRFWHVLELLFENQGTENAGWVSEPLLRSVGAAVPGLDAQKMLDGRQSAQVTRALSEAAALAQEAGVSSTPSFAVGRNGGPLKVVTISSLDTAGIAPALDAALRQ